MRGARAGTVVFVSNISGNTTGDPSVPGYGTAVLIRHSDNTVAAYDHLSFNSVKVAVGQSVHRGGADRTVGELSGNTGNSFGPHLHFEVVNFWNSVQHSGPSLMSHFEDKNHAYRRPRVDQGLTPTI